VIFSTGVIDSVHMIEVVCPHNMAIIILLLTLPEILFSSPAESRDSFFSLESVSRETVCVRRR